MIKIDLEPSYILHIRPYRESSQLIDVLTRNHGLLRMVSRGSRGSKSKIQYFQKILISYSGKSELKKLIKFEMDDYPRIFLGEKLMLGIYLNELITRLLLHEDPHPEIFKIYGECIQNLFNADHSKSLWILRIFEHQLLNFLGYGIECKEDIYGQVIDNNAQYNFIDQEGFHKSSEGKITGRLIQALSVQDIEMVPSDVELKICRNLNRERLAPYIGDKPLQSRKLFEGLKK